LPVALWHIKGSIRQCALEDVLILCPDVTARSDIPLPSES